MNKSEAMVRDITSHLKGKCKDYGYTVYRQEE